MKQGKRKSWLLLLVIASLLVNAVMTTPALADDSLPPPSETTEESAPPQEPSGGDASQEPSSSDTGAGTPAEEEPASSEVPAEQSQEPASTEEGTPAEEPVASETPTEETSVAEVLAEVPAGTEVVVLDESGEAVPLATEQAAEIVYAGDPIWCPVGVAVPTPNKNGCSPSFTKFGALTDGALDSLLGWLNATNPAKAGVVWIEKTYNSNAAGDGNVVFNGASLTNMANFSLTLKGGWNGLGTGTVDVNDPSVFDNSSLSIINWKGAVTLSDIVVTNAITGTCGAALCVDTAGTIKLERVSANGNDGTLDGVVLDNRNSTTSGSVTVIGGSYSDNYRYGLAINTAGAVTLRDVVANASHYGGGVYINNGWDAAASAVSITNSVFFSNGDSIDDHGLFVLSNGNVTLANIRAGGNASGGMHINNTYGSGNVALNGINKFLDNGTDGFSIVTKGNVTIRHLIAFGNGNSGAIIDNVNAPAPKAVTLSGSGLFSNNSVNGLKILSSGAVTLNNLTALNNGHGVHIENHGFTFGAVAAPVRINGVNNFSDNTGHSLFVDSDGAILLSRVTADSNGLGVSLRNHTPDNGPQNVSVLGYLNSINNTTRGVYIETQGAITIANLNASHNGGNGAYLNNGFGNAPRNVTLTGMNTFRYNVQNGLVIYSRGAVALSNVTAIGNGMVSGFSGNYSGVLIGNDYDPAVQMNVTLTGTNVFNNNGLHGLAVASYGAISLSNATAIGNGKAVPDGLGSGAYLQNINGALVKPVTVSGVNLFEDNQQYGLQVFSDGAITVSKVTAGKNSWNGVDLKNDTGKAQSRVTILGYGMFDSNLGDGLSVNSNGVIVTSNLTADQNGFNGVYLKTKGLSAPQAVTLNGTNSFIGNGGTGLYVETDGNITVNNLTANGNGGTGVYLKNDNTAFATFGSVSIKGYGNISNNTYDGLFVRSLGNATLVGLNVHDNGISATHNGITLRVDGNVNLACFSAYNNEGYDLLVTSSNGMGPAQSVTLSGFYLSADISALSVVNKPCP